MHTDIVMVCNISKSVCFSRIIITTRGRLITSLVNTCTAVVDLIEGWIAMECMVVAHAAIPININIL